MDIKFRGKRKGGTEWLIGDLNHLDDGIYIFPRGNEALYHSPDWFEVNPDSAGQFTGVRDIDGKDLYVRDICDNEAARWIIVFNKGCFSAEIIGHKRPADSISLALRAIRGIKLIGNADDNPELLKAKP